MDHRPDGYWQVPVLRGVGDWEADIRAEAAQDDSLRRAYGCMESAANRQHRRDHDRSATRLILGPFNIRGRPSDDEDLF